MDTRYRVPWLFGGTALALMTCSLLGIARCEELAEATPAALEHQALWVAIALVTGAIVASANYRLLASWSYSILFAAVIMLVAVYLFPPVNGAHRWIRLGPIGFQPSEFAKLAVVLALANYLMRRAIRVQLAKLLPALAMTVVPLWLVLKEPDLGTSLVFLPVLFAMLIVAGARWRHLMALALIGIAATPAVSSQMSRDQRSRVTALWDRDGGAKSPTPAAYHLRQAEQMLASGGIWGTALTGEADDSVLSDHRVPEAPTDSIFSVLGERYGIVGCSIVLGLYALLIWQGLAMAARTREPFGRLIVVGVMTTIGFQAVVNTGMLVGLLPITGLPLPLISYGGSGLVANAIGLGLVASVASRPGFEMA